MCSDLVNSNVTCFKWLYIVRRLTQNRNHFSTEFMLHYSYRLCHATFFMPVLLEFLTILGRSSEACIGPSENDLRGCSWICWIRSLIRQTSFSPSLISWLNELMTCHPNCLQWRPHQLHGLSITCLNCDLQPSLEQRLQLFNWINKSQSNRPSEAYTCTLQYKHGLSMNRFSCLEWKRLKVLEADFTFLRPRSAQTNDLHKHSWQRMLYMSAWTGSALRCNWLQ